MWSFGEENFSILKELVLLREKLRPYICEQMRIASEKGYPVMRPMFFDYPEDEVCYRLGEQYLFGEDILFAPIVNQGQTTKTVYVPEGKWILTKNKQIYTKGFYEIEADIHEFIAFVRADAKVLEAF